MFSPAFHYQKVSLQMVYNTLGNIFSQYNRGCVEMQISAHPLKLCKSE